MTDISHHVPETSIATEGGETLRVIFAASSMQGYPDKMEDAVSLQILQRLVVKYV